MKYSFVKAWTSMVVRASICGSSMTRSKRISYHNEQGRGQKLYTSVRIKVLYSTNSSIAHHHYLFHRYVSKNKFSLS